MNNKVVLIGLGNRARSGKDWCAEYLHGRLENNSMIVHWADALKDEVSNVSSEKNPLIRTHIAVSTSDGEEFRIYAVLDKVIDGRGYYEIVSSMDCPKLDEVMHERGITTYEKMTTKDSTLLQFWGTDFRRRRFGEDYWVNELMRRIDFATKDYDGDEDFYVLIPDTRFQNEYDAIKKAGGYYWSIVRVDQGGKQMFATDRDPNHMSETGLDYLYGDLADVSITAVHGDLSSLAHQASDALTSVKQSRARYTECPSWLEREEVAA